MTRNDIQEVFSRVTSLIRQKRLTDAMDKLSSTLQAHPVTEATDELNELRTTYEQMLRFTVQGADDPMRSNIYRALVLDLYALTDRLKSAWVLKLPDSVSFTRNHFLETRHDLKQLTEEYASLHMHDDLSDLLEQTSIKSDLSAGSHDLLIQRIFNVLWLTDEFSAEETALIRDIFTQPSFASPIRSMLVSALSLNLFRYFHEDKFMLLADLYDNADEDVALRALTGLLFALNIYNDRLESYDRLKARLEILASDPLFESDAESLIIQTIRSKDTEKLNQQFQKEIVPDIMKLNQNLSEKLDLSDLLKEEDRDDENPKWEKYFDNQPGLFQKLEELTNMQMEGADLYMSAFSMLKNFPFFRYMHNWFLPFYKEHPEIEDVLKNEEESFRKLFPESIENAIFMCNSDKYSFLLNAPHLPEAQKSMLGHMLAAEAEQIAELNAEQAYDPALRRKRKIVHYVQDLYRFYNLYFSRFEFENIFRLQTELFQSKMFQQMFTSNEKLLSVARFYFDNHHWEKTVQLSELLIGRGLISEEIYGKMGYAYQKMGDLDQAIAYFRQADLFDDNKPWTLSKIAQCYLKLDQPEKALESYLELAALEPDNPKHLASIGTCNLSMNQPENALEYFYKIEIQHPGSLTALRPIGWCLFLLNRVSEAEAVYGQILELAPNGYDYMNAGHVALCLQKRPEAVQHYVQSLRMRNGSLMEFLQAFNEDRKYLRANGVDNDEIPLIMDYVRFLNRSEE